MSLFFNDFMVLFYFILFYSRTNKILAKYEHVLNVLLMDKLFQSNPDRVVTGLKTRLFEDQFSGSVKADI